MPKLLQDAIEQHSYDVDVITKNLKLPWLKLDLDFGEWTEEHVSFLQSNDDWRKKWKFPDSDKNSYQVKNWNGKLFFGPTDFDKFLKLSGQNEHDHDEDSKCRRYRDQLDYGWYSDNSIKTKINKLIPDSDLNLVNSYILPSGGYVFPHRDYAIDNIGLAKIYVAVRWGEGNVFGQYGCGNIPVKEGDVFLVNNYTLPHWVFNGSDRERIVLDISANLHSDKIKESIFKAFRKGFYER